MVDFYSRKHAYQSASQYELNFMTDIILPERGYAYLYRKSLKRWQKKLINTAIEIVGGENLMQLSLLKQAVENRNKCFQNNNHRKFF